MHPTICFHQLGTIERGSYAKVCGVDGKLLPTPYLDSSRNRNDPTPYLDSYETNHIEIYGCWASSSPPMGLFDG